MTDHHREIIARLTADLAAAKAERDTLWKDAALMGEQRDTARAELAAAIKRAEDAEQAARSWEQQARLKY